MFRSIWRAQAGLLALGVVLVGGLLLSDALAPLPFISSEAPAGAAVDASRSDVAAVSSARIDDATSASAGTSPGAVTAGQIGDALARFSAGGGSGVDTLARPAQSTTTDTAAAVTTLEGGAGATVSVPRNAADGVTIAFPDTGTVGVGLPDAASSGTAQRLDDGTIAFPGGGSSANAVIPTAVGAQMLTVVQDATAPTRYAYPLTLPTGRTWSRWATVPRSSTRTATRS